MYCCFCTFDLGGKFFSADIFARIFRTSEVLQVEVGHHLDNPLLGVQGVEDICIAPSESLGAHLSSSVLVDLLVHSAAVVLDVHPESGHHSISGTDAPLGKLG